MTSLEGVLEPEVLPAERPAGDVDVGREVRRWWEEQELGDTVDQVTLAKALADVGVLSLGCLARALTNGKVSMKDKVKIALVMAPKLVAEARGRLRGGTGSGASTPNGEGADKLLESYGLKARSG